MAVDLIARAKSGDEIAFRELVDPYRHELQVHCYRFLGSLQDAEDALQETLVAAWRGLGAFEERAALRTWLYRIATNRCLNMLRSARRHPEQERPVNLDHPDLPEPSHMGEVAWLEPYPDLLLDSVPDRAPGPAARYETLESVSLAFVTALQLLPPRQRAALILRDVLGFHAAEVADMLETTEESVTSALKRARATLDQRLEETAEAPPAPGSPDEQELVERLTRAFESSDIDAVIALLSDDVRIAMPPLPLEYHGREVAGRFLNAVTDHRRNRYRVIPTRANGQPAIALYILDPQTDTFHAVGLLVATLAGREICALTRFDTGVLPHFALPRKIPA